MMESIHTGAYPVSIPFKGQRDYIYGPTIVETTLAVFAQTTLTRARFSQHGFIRQTGCVLFIMTEIPGKDIDAPFRGQVDTHGVTYWITVTPDPDSTAPSVRTPYDETLVTDVCKIEGATVTRLGALPCTLTETIVSMKKYLLQHLYPDVVGKWAYTSVDYKKEAKAFTSLTIRMDHNLANKLVKSTILADNEPIGLLYFSLVTV